MVNSIYKFHVPVHIACWSDMSDIICVVLAGHFHDDDLDICTCTSRKIWSVKDTEALLKVWRETLTQVGAVGGGFTLISLIYFLSVFVVAAVVI